MNASPYILVLSSVDSVISSGYYSRLFHKLSIQLKTRGIDVTVLSPKSVEGEGGKFNTQQLSWLRYCVDTVGGCDLHHSDHRPANTSNHLVQKIQDIIKGSIQIFKQCWHQKPAILQVYQPLSYGLMALPASLIFGIPMALSFGMEHENFIPQSWIKRLILKKMMRFSKVVIVSSEQAKSDLKSQLRDIEIVVIPQEESTYSPPARSLFPANDAQQCSSPEQMSSSRWQETIELWCQVFAKLCDYTSLQDVSSWNEKDFVHNLFNAKNGFKKNHLMSPPQLCTEGKRYISPVINIAYYRKREFYKIFNR